MTDNRPDIWKVIDRATDLHRQLGAALTELRAHASALDLPDAAPRPHCPECGIQRPEHLLVDHLVNVHQIQQVEAESWLRAQEDSYA